MKDTQEIMDRVENQLRLILERIPVVNSLQIRKDQLFLGKNIDFTVGFELECKQKEFIVQVNDHVTPKTLREICVQWRRSIPENAENTYPVIAASYLSDSSIEVCKENKVGCFDTQGNCYFSFGPLYIEIKGIPNVNPSKRSIQTIFSPKSSRISRVLLSKIDKLWQIQEVAKEAKISIGLVSDVKNRLLEEELIVEQGKSIRVKDPLKLINRWLHTYSYKKNKRNDYYALESNTAFEKNIAAVCNHQGIQYALGLFTGANKVAPSVRMEKLFVFIGNNIDPVAKELNLKKVSSGANIILLQPFDLGVFYRSRDVDGIQIVSNLQLYLDLITYKGRGEEAASAILKNMEAEWSQNQTMNPGK
jgi:hypothetical protein